MKPPSDGRIDLEAAEGRDGGSEVGGSGIARCVCVSESVRALTLCGWFAAPRLLARSPPHPHTSTPVLAQSRCLARMRERSENRLGEGEG